MFKCSTGLLIQGISSEKFFFFIRLFFSCCVYIYLFNRSQIETFQLSDSFNVRMTLLNSVELETAIKVTGYNFKAPSLLEGVDDIAIAHGIR